MAYFSDQWQSLEERLDASAAAERQFVWGERYIDDLVLRDRSTGGGSLNERLYALQDALFNVVALTDASGALQERFAYQPYGQSLPLNPDFSAYSGADRLWEYRFTGRELDLDSGLQINRNRYLHLQLGRWINRDPIGYDDGQNMYNAYFAPSGTDSLGTKACKIAHFGPVQSTGCRYDKTIAGGHIGWRFLLDAEFGPPCCECCEYRQYVSCFSQLWIFLRGKWSAWTVIAQDPGELVEDCDDIGCYGHRDGRQTPIDMYHPGNPATACQYKMQDTPGLPDINNTLNKWRLLGATHIEFLMNCRFLLNITDVCNNKVLQAESLYLDCHRIEPT